MILHKTMKFLKPRKRRGSSLVFLGFSVIIFIVTYGLLFIVAAAILGSFFSATNQVPISDPGWLATYVKTQTTLKFLIPLMPTIGIFILVIKVLMTASTRGRD